MAVPRVVIVGRPNVGKSSLLNWLAGLRLAIVDDQPGVTRDRVDYLMSYEDRFFELVDTGGIGIQDEDNLTQHIEEQIQTAILRADLFFGCNRHFFLKKRSRFELDGIALKERETKRQKDRVVS